MQTGAPGESKVSADHILPQVHSSPTGYPRVPILQLKIVEPERGIVDGDPKTIPVKTRADLQKIVKEAKTQVRVAGSKHSVREAIYVDNSQGMNLELAGSELREVKFIDEGTDQDGKYAVVHVGAGCHLGKDPKDPLSTQENSLNEQLTKKGYALPIVGGIVHQSIAGFLQTGSAGGSTFYSFVDAVESIEFVNGKGDVIQAKRGEDLFNAVGVSMGLMGVVTAVSLKVRELYTVEAVEQIVEEKDSWVAKTQTGSYPFENLLRTSQYIHLNWFPQPGVRKVLQWMGAKKPAFKPGEKPTAYKNLLGDFLNAASAAGLLAIIDLIRRQPDEPSDFQLKMIAGMLNAFLSKSDPATYRDNWDKILATENDVPVDSIMKTYFFELWFPIEQTTKVIDVLNDLYKDPKVALGNYGMEMYGAKESPFWLSPAYGRNVVRIDPFWWAFNQDDPAAYFKIFFDKMLTIPGARLHWGKFLPVPNESGFNLKYLMDCYPKMQDWLKIRREMDPRDVFLTSYWRKIFYPGPTEENNQRSVLTLRGA